MDTLDSINNFISDMEANIDIYRRNIDKSASYIEYMRNIKLRIEHPVGLLYSVERGDIMKTVALVEDGAFMDPVNDKGETPLMIAIDNIKKNRLYTDICIFLINNGADINAVCDNGTSVIVRAFCAELSGSEIVVPRVCQLLIDRGVCTDYMDPNVLNEMKCIMNIRKEAAETDINSLINIFNRSSKIDY
jgi:hypothetical protein